MTVRSSTPTIPAPMQVSRRFGVISPATARPTPTRIPVRKNFPERGSGAVAGWALGAMLGG